MRNEREAIAFRKGMIAGVEHAREDLAEVKKEYRALHQIDKADFDPLSKLDKKLEIRMAEAEL